VQTRGGYEGEPPNVRRQELGPNEGAMKQNPHLPEDSAGGEVQSIVPDSDKIKAPLAKETLQPGETAESDVLDVGA